MTKLTSKHSTPTRWIMMGVSGCGKSEIGIRLAAALAVPFIEGDMFHPAANVAKMSVGIALNDADRSEWLYLLQAEIRGARQCDAGLVLSCSALKRRYRDVLRAADPALCFAHLEGARDLITSRMHARVGHYMPPSLLESQLHDLEPLQDDEAGVRLDIRSEPAELIAEILRSPCMAR
jgi:gluconokinase